ncbi:MAG: hypothetical protein WC532_04180 [Candidatus Omnitrophota bacterium]
MKDLKIIFIAFLLGVSIFSAVRYISALREQNMLHSSLEEKKTEIAGLENQKQNLLQEIEKEKETTQKFMRINARLKDSLKAGASRISRLFGQYMQAQEDNERLNSQVAILKAENDAVRVEEIRLKLELEHANQEKEALSSRLSSLSELKKAIRELKNKKGSTSVEIKKIEVKKKPLKDTEPAGNRGYIIKDGVFVPGSSSAKVKIEVSPALKD